MIKEKERLRHEVWMNRLLSEILDDKYLSLNCFFKGGTCAAMLGYLDRFSVDLDFDISKDANKSTFSLKLNSIFNSIGLEVKDKSENALQFFLRYPSEDKSRNTLKVEFLDKHYSLNRYKACYLKDIERTAVCQTIETMFSHKLVAPIDRYEKSGSVAGRDIYDIHHFFYKGYDYNKELIKERTNLSSTDLINKLIDFIDKKVDKKVVDEDLNALLDYEKFKKTRKYLKEEVLRFLKNEL